MPVNYAPLDILNLRVETREKGGARRRCTLLFLSGLDVDRDVGKKKAVLEDEAASGAVEEKKEEAAIAEAGAPSGVEAEKKEPVWCIHEDTDAELRREFPDICSAFIKKAKDGSIPALKLLLEIRAGKYGDAKVAKQQGGKSLSEMLMDELKRRQDEREEAADAAKAEEQVANDTGNEGAKSGGEAE